MLNFPVYFFIYFRQIPLRVVCEIMRTRSSAADRIQLHSHWSYYNGEAPLGYPASSHYSYCYPTCLNITRLSHLTYQVRDAIIRIWPFMDRFSIQISIFSSRESNQLFFMFSYLKVVSSRFDKISYFNLTNKLTY